MNRSDSVLLVAACLVCLGVVTSGFVDFGSSPPPIRGDGTADMTVESVPESEVTLTRGRFDSGTYHLDAAPTTVTADRVRGNPAVKLALDIPALEYIDATVYDLAGREGDTIELTFSENELSPKRVTADEYDATLSIWLQERNGQFRALYQQQIIVEVR